ncbi:unnamed protein product [Blepharisma stoltei]|uniref:Reverse transcriptase zinc-binding domain-containing protein n=1 Tax=Blepharisma stoltei TaxID=1481888 RepID=A0AAU9J0V2_9CILI|nr:unnamed protein product [Blepharisma stoltei]
MSSSSYRAKRDRGVLEKYGLEDVDIENYLFKIIKTFEDKKIERMATERWKTTELYRYLSDCEVRYKLPICLQGASETSKAVSIIFGLRSGSNFTNHCRFVRHIADSSECRFCGEQVEDEVHAIENCYIYESSRVKLINEMEKLLKEDFYLLSLTEIILCGWRFDKIMRLKHSEHIWKVNEEIRKFIGEIFKIRKYLEGKVGPNAGRKP